MTAGKRTKIHARLRAVAGTGGVERIGPEAFRLVLREVLFDGEGVAEWRRQAACATADRGLFYPPDGWIGQLAVDAGKAVCAVQYFAAVEPQKRGAPHLHAAVRGTMPRKLIRQVVAATYHQVWWPAHDRPAYTAADAPVWDEQAGGYVDRTTRVPLPTWDRALDAIDADPDAQPAHVIRFGTRGVDVQGVVEGTEQAGGCLTYLVKYLTKSLGDCHQPESPAAAEHVRRLTAELRWTPCSPRCANWLLYGVQPEQAHRELVPGACPANAHKAHTLGYGGRRCLVSRKWTGKTLDQHRAERRAHVMRALGAVGIRVDQDTPADAAPDRYRGELISSTDPNPPDRTELLIRAVNQRLRWRAEYELARSATVDQVVWPAGRWSA